MPFLTIVFKYRSAWYESFKRVSCFQILFSQPDVEECSRILVFFVKSKPVNDIIAVVLTSLST